MCHHDRHRQSGRARCRLSVGWKARAARGARRSDEARARLLRTASGSGRPESARELRHQRPPRHVARRHVHRGAHPGDHAGDLRLPARRTASTGRCIWARTRTRCRARPSARALEVLAANGVDAIIQRDDGVTPTPVISRAILVYNRGRADHLADGIVITPSHNPPEDGGFKYNPPNGGPADTDVTRWIQDRANALAQERQRRGQTGPIGGGAVGRDDAPAKIFVAALRRRSGERHRHGGDSSQRPQARRRSAGRRVAARTGSRSTTSTA